MVDYYTCILFSCFPLFLFLFIKNRENVKHTKFCVLKAWSVQNMLPLFKFLLLFLFFWFAFLDKEKPDFFYAPLAPPKTCCNSHNFHSIELKNWRYILERRHTNKDFAKDYGAYKWIRNRKPSNTAILTLFYFFIVQFLSLRSHFDSFARNTKELFLNAFLCVFGVLVCVLIFLLIFCCGLFTALKQVVNQAIDFR